MPLDQEIRSFIKDHLYSDPAQLLFSASRYPQWNMKEIVAQIEARKSLKEKIPLWAENEYLIFPAKIAAEQCSSIHTADYKSRLLKGNSLTDLTGGLGVDTFFFAQKATTVLYIEKEPEYVRCAQHNFQILEQHNIQVMHLNSEESVDSIPPCDTFYIDPARRSTDNQRLFAFEQCSPDIVKMKDSLLKKSQRIIVKASPMIDIEAAVQQLAQTQEVHIVAVKNECKEVLFVLEDREPVDRKIYTAHFRGSQAELFSFDRQREKELSVPLDQPLQSYLYEPNSAILKAGGFKSVAVANQVNKISQHSHLYTSDTLKETFPGRKFKIEKVIEFSSKEIKHLYKEYPKANLSTRNFPIDTHSLGKKLKIKEGGECYIFATSHQGKRILLICHKL